MASNHPGEGDTSLANPNLKDLPRKGLGNSASRKVAKGHKVPNVRDNPPSGASKATTEDVKLT